VGENNSVSFALELLQLFCKINTSSPWTSKVYARAYHRLIWRFLGRITNDPIVGRLTRSLPLSRRRGPPVHVARAPARLDSVNSESLRSRHSRLTAAPPSLRRSVARDRTRWKTRAHLDAATSIFHSRCARQLVQPREAEQFWMVHIRNRKPCDAVQVIELGLGLDRSNSSAGESR